jgi:cob(I)alamin adenosyltransferase
MVKLNKIYTRTGDDGTTGIVGGFRVQKSSLRVCAFGEIDELNAHIGLIYTLSQTVPSSPLSDKLLTIENELFDIGAELATPPGAEWPTMAKVNEALVLRLETWIDELNAPLPELRSFVLPGGTVVNAHLHIARAVCRRAERAILMLRDEESVSSDLLRYVNRLSDLLFVMSRYDIHVNNLSENLWVPGGSRPT